MQAEDFVVAQFRRDPVIVELMNPAEKLLYSAVRESPGDWGIRLELCRKLVSRGAAKEAAKVVSEGLGVPRSEEELREALRFSGDAALTGNWETILHQYLVENPTSALARRAAASICLTEGNAERAAGLYQSAVSLSPGLRDFEFEKRLAVLLPDALPGEENTHSRIEVVPAAVAPTQIEVVPAAAGPPEGIEVVPAAVSQPPAETGESETGEELLEEAEEKEVTEGEEGTKNEEEPEPDKSSVLRVVGSSELIKAAERESERKEQLSSLYVALGIHVVLIILLAFWIVTGPPPVPPRIVTRAPASEREEIVRKERKRTPSESSPAAASRMEAVSSISELPIAMPEMDASGVMAGPVGMNAGFGPSVDFGGRGGGLVSFFGSRAKAKKIVFVVDASASMKKAGSSGKRRFDLMKEELKKSISALPLGVYYQIIFFNGPAWFAGQAVDRANWHEKNARNFWSYKDGNPDELPRAPMIRVTPKQIRQSLQQIDDVRMDYGTDWRSPLKMAMNLSPDLIFFMTDGAVFENPDDKPLVEDLLEYNQRKSKARINCISLMATDAFDMMNELTTKTKGEISLVLEDSKVLRGRAVEDYAKKSKGKK